MPIRYKIGARWGSGSWHCPTHHWRTFCDREHPKCPWLRVCGRRRGAYPCDHTRLDQFVQPTKISPNVDKMEQGHRWWKHPFASLLIRRAWLVVPQLFWHRCCGRVQLARNEEHLTIFKPNSTSCLVWNGVWRLMMHDVCWRWVETKRTWGWSSTLNPQPKIVLELQLHFIYGIFWILFMVNMALKNRMPYFMRSELNWMKLTQLLSKKTVNLRIPYCKSTFASKFLMLILDVYTGEK